MLNDENSDPVGWNTKRKSGFLPSCAILGRRPAAWLAFDIDGSKRTEFIVRDIEKDRAIKKVKADKVSCPADYEPAGGLSGDRATATAQAVAECARRAGVQRVITDRTLPFIFAWHLQQAGIAVDYSAELGVIDRRVKDQQELEWLAEAQQATESAMLMACETVARATANRDGLLLHDGAELTSERLRKMISAHLLELGYGNAQTIPLLPPLRTRQIATNVVADRCERESRSSSISFPEASRPVTGVIALDR